MAKFYVVLGDDVLKEFLAFKHGKQYKSSLITKLLHLYKPDYLTNKNQLDRIGISDRSIIASMSASNRLFNNNMSLVDLAKETVYKIILSTENKPFPYVNIHSAILNNFYSITAKPTESRSNITEYLKVLCANAREIKVYDHYFDYSNDSTKNCITKRSVELLTLFPDSIDIIFEIKHSISQNCKDHIKTTYPRMKVSYLTPMTYDNHHDRYILIDKKIEVIITSGIDYIFNDGKECTIIVRERS